MDAAKSLQLPDAFYGLVLDEIASQPNLQNELGDNDFGDVVLRAFGRGIKLVCEEIEKCKHGLPISPFTGLGFAIVNHLAPPPKSMIRDISELLSVFFGSNYDALCRSALLHLFWGEIKKAEKKINLAKHKHDDRAFAHHVYGLLRGLQGNAGGSRFELQLAIEREVYIEPKERIQRAIAILS